MLVYPLSPCLLHTFLPTLLWGCEDTLVINSVVLDSVVINSVVLDSVEIDSVVLDASLPLTALCHPQMAIGFQDPRTTLHICDGIKFVQDTPADTYDVIIVDSSDPVGPAEVLFEKVGCARVAGTMPHPSGVQQCMPHPSGA